LFSTPAILLPVLFLVMTFAGYKFGQLGARQVPYAYLLPGVTTLVVVSDALQVLDLIGRCHAFGDSLSECGCPLNTLQIQRVLDPTDFSRLLSSWRIAPSVLQ
jgi:hypothetical protein